MTSGDIRLRPVREADLSWLERYFREPDFGGEFDWTGFSDPGKVRRRFAEDGYLSDIDGRLVVETATGLPLGTISWRSQVYGGNFGAPCWEIGIALWPEHRGQGHGTQAQRMMADYLFAHTPVNRVEALTLTDNIAEQRALEKAGFRRDAVLREYWFQRGQWRDTVVYGLLRGER
ncbi:N-acetyltransferase [Pseudonocardiaceae bacterium YIM PH 21723]|nr:N-acetyltransferase [Pseudonocardiaceae bacterium YIM PH 21723]